MQWMEGKNGAFSMKAMYKALEIKTPISLLVEMVWGNCVAKTSLFCLGAT